MSEGSEPLSKRNRRARRRQKSRRVFSTAVTCVTDSSGAPAHTAGKFRVGGAGLLQL